MSIPTHLKSFVTSLAISHVVTSLIILGSFMSSPNNRNVPLPPDDACMEEAAPTLECRMRDSLVLVDLYNSTDGPNWIKKWDLNKPMTTWYGIGLGTGGCVEALSLSGNQLKGSIPNFNLPNLSNLYLDNNQLTGSILNFNMPNMRYLSLGDNQLTGTIPNFNMPNLESLQLYSNQLTGTIPNFNMPNLQYLYLGINQLTGQIPNFNMPNLWSLQLSSNQLTGSIPNFNLPNLQELHLSSNQLTGTIPNFNLPNLWNLQLNNNKLQACMPSSLKLYCRDSVRVEVVRDSFFRKVKMNVDLSNNPLLPWQGDFTKYCATNGSQAAQIGASCNDGNPKTIVDAITSDCLCKEIQKECVIILKPDVVKIPFGIQRNIDVTLNDSLPKGVTIKFSTPDVTDISIATVNKTTLGISRNGTWKDTIIINYQVCSDSCSNCSNSVIKLVAQNDITIVPVTVITPNGDGVNDLLRFNDESEIPESELKIFNRWGNQIYSKKNYTNDWDAGGYSGGVYYYVLIVGESVYKKNLTIIK